MSTILFRGFSAEDMLKYMVSIFQTIQSVTKSKDMFASLKYVKYCSAKVFKVSYSASELDVLQRDE